MANYTPYQFSSVNSGQPGQNYVELANSSALGNSGTKGNLGSTSYYEQTKSTSGAASGAAAGAQAGSSLGPWGAAIGAVLGGIGGAMQSSADKKKTKEAMAFEREQLYNKANEDRKTLMYTGMLEDYYKTKARYGQGKGLDNWKDYSQSLGGGRYSALNNMMNFKSTNTVKDPGIAPPSPEPLFEQRAGSSTNYDRLPSYQFNPTTGVLEAAALPPPKKKKG